VVGLPPWYPLHLLHIEQLEAFDNMICVLSFVPTITLGAVSKTLQ